MNIRLLNTDDVNSLKDLLNGQRSYFGLDIDDFPGDVKSEQAIRTFLNTYLRVDNPYFRCYGYFDGDQLIGTISADFMQDQPTWVLRRICVDEARKGQTTAIIQELMSTVLDYAESVGYYQHIYLIPAKYKRAHAKIWETNKLRKEGRYIAYELERVSAGGSSRFRLFNEMLYGRIKFPIDTVVRMSMLSEEYRAT